MKHKCLASFIVFLLFFSISFFIGFAQVKLILDAKTFLNILEEAKIYENLAQIGQEIAQSSAQSEDKNTMTQIMIRAATKSLEPSWLRDQAQKNVPALFDYLNGKTTTAAINIPLTDFKNALRPNLEAATKEEISNLPACPPGEITPQDKFPECLPAGTTAEQVNALIGPSDFDEFLDEIPEVWNPSNESLSALRGLFLAIKIGFWASLIFSLIFIGILILLGRGYWPSIPRWIGLSLVLPSALVLLLDFSWSAIQKLAIDQAGSQMTTTSQIYNPILVAIDKFLYVPGLVIAGIFFGLGAILIILSYALPHPPEPKPLIPTQPPAAPNK